MTGDSVDEPHQCFTRITEGFGSDAVGCDLPVDAHDNPSVLQRAERPPLHRLAENDKGRACQICHQLGFASCLHVGVPGVRELDRGEGLCDRPY